MRYALKIALIAALLFSCSSTSGAHKSLLVGTWVSDIDVTLREAKRRGTKLPDWIHERLGETAYILSSDKITFTVISDSPDERSWFRWKVSDETDTHIVLETGSAIMFAKQIQRFNKNVGCFENVTTNTFTNEPEKNFTYHHFYCRKNEKDI